MKGWEYVHAHMEDFESTNPNVKTRAWSIWTLLDEKEMLEKAVDELPYLIDVVWNCGRRKRKRLRKLMLVPKERRLKVINEELRNLGMEEK